MLSFKANQLLQVSQVAFVHGRWRHMKKKRGREEERALLNISTDVAMRGYFAVFCLTLMLTLTDCADESKLFYLTINEI